MRKIYRTVAVGICLTVFMLFFSGIVYADQDGTFSIAVESSDDLSASNPQSPYGKALKENLVDGLYFSDWDKVNIITETYYERFDKTGKRQQWVVGTDYDDPNTGYHIGFYYADGMPFYAYAYEEYSKRTNIAFYFWGEQLIACYDRTDGPAEISFSGEADYNRIVEAFENLYDVAIELTRPKKLSSDHERKQLTDSVETGDIVAFGMYEQDNNFANGKEPIEWVVLDKQDGKCLLLSLNALDSQEYNKTYTIEPWETCSLRNWLNDTFLRKSFCEEERKKISAVSVTSDNNPKYNTDPGMDTTDTVFLLSISEADRYFSEDSKRECRPTAYAEAQNYLYQKDGYCAWWLRTPGNEERDAAYICNDGSINYDGAGGAHISSCHGVRPALWIELASKGK